MRKIGLLILLILTGCIHNDIPLPIIAGEVKTIAFEGQSECTIDLTTRTINLTLNDQADLRAVKVTDLSVTPNSSTSLKVGTVIDFSAGSEVYEVSSEPYSFNIFTYQYYEWKIVCTQPIERKVAVANGIGEANIDLRNKVVVVKVPQDQDLFGVVVNDFCLAPASAVYTPDPYTITDFNQSVKFDVSFFGLTETWTVNVQRTLENVVTGTVNPWGTFANVTGSVQAGSTLAAGFDYRKKSAADWSYMAATVSGGKISARLPNLSPNTEYQFRARLGEETAATTSFRTEPIPIIANMGLDEWALNGKTWYANSVAASSIDQGFWGTGNEGVTSPMAGGNDSNTSPTTDVQSGAQAASIKTISVPIVSLAAGSLFTGYFQLTIATPLNSPKFSRPYIGRPTKLKFWYKYDPKIIEVVRNGAPAKVGDVDQCMVYMYLGDWDGELLSSELKKDKTRGVIAYGEFVTNKKVDTYTQQTIEMQYYDVNRPVKKIIIVATSSIYGDFYTGGIGSTLLLDNLEFGWD